MTRLEPQTGTAFRLSEGQLLRVIDLEGEQVADLTAFNGSDKTEWLSSGRSIDYANRIYLTKGDILYSNRSRPMFTIVEDAVGRHDFLLTPCSPETFRIIYKNAAAHPSCFHNLATHLAPFGIARIHSDHVQYFHERRDRCQRSTPDPAAPIQSRRIDCLARRNGPDRRPHRLFGRNVEQLRFKPIGYEIR